MCGRLREEGGQVILLVMEELKAQILPKFQSSEDGTEIVQFHLEATPAELPLVDLRRLILELIFWYPLSERQLLQRLTIVVCFFLNEVLQPLSMKLPKFLINGDRCDGNYCLLRFRVREK